VEPREGKKNTKGEKALRKFTVTEKKRLPSDRRGRCLGEKRKKKYYETERFVPRSCTKAFLKEALD